MAQTVEDLGRLIKQKHPDYGDIPDAELGRKIKLKYKGSYDDFEDAPSIGLPGPSKPSNVIQPVSLISGKPSNITPEEEQQFKTAGQKELNRDAQATGDLLPMAGGMVAGIPGAALGSSIKNVLSKNPSLTDVASDTISQGVIPKVLGNILSRSPKETIANVISKKIISNNSPSIQGAVRNEANVAEMSRVAEQNATNEAEITANNLRKQNEVNTFNTQREQTALDATKTNKEAFQQQKLAKQQNVNDLTQKTSSHITDENSIVKEIADKSKDSLLSNPSAMTSNSIGRDLYKAANGDIPLSKVTDRAFSNINDLRQLKLLDPVGVEKIGISRAVGKGFNGSKVNPDKILSELDSDIYKEALNPETHKNLKELMTSLKSESEKIIPLPEKVLPVGEKLKFTPDKFVPEKPSLVGKENATSIEKLLSYKAGRILLPLPLYAVPVVGHQLAGAAATGVLAISLGESAIGRLMQDPQLAKLTLQAIKTPLKSPESTILSKAITYGLRGATVMFTNEDGKEEKATFGPQGELQYLRK